LKKKFRRFWPLTVSPIFFRHRSYLHQLHMEAYMHSKTVILLGPKKSFFYTSVKNKVTLSYYNDVFLFLF